MTKRLRRATICTMMALVIFITSFAATSVTARAADPYWGASYMSPGSGKVTIYIDNITSNISKATLKSWDFSGGGSFVAYVYSPSGQLINKEMPIFLGINDTTPAQLGAICTEKGTYRIEVNLYGGNSGGWIGCWLY